MARRTFRFLLAGSIALTGCSALLDVKDIYFDPNAVTQGGDDGSTDGGPNAEGSAGDGGADGAACNADTAIDAKNCGRCGHSCQGGMCSAGKCQAVQLGFVADAPLDSVAVSDQYVFASTRIKATPEVGGLWRVPKAGGPVELYVNIRYAEQMAILGDKLYFGVDEDPANGSDKFGGLYSCPLVGPAPCSPTLIAAGTSIYGLSLDKTRIYYTDDTTGKGMMVYEPPQAPKVFRADYGFSGSIFVDGNDAYYSVTITDTPYRAKVFFIDPDAGATEKYFYESATAEDGRLIGDKNALLFTAYDFANTSAGIVRRIPRNGSAPCNVGGTGQKRPYGIYADTDRIYWANQGEGATLPFTKGSVVSCEQAGCCTTPEVMWAGDGHPTGVTGDADAIYFVTHATGAIWKIAKP